MNREPNFFVVLAVQTDEPIEVWAAKLLEGVDTKDIRYVELRDIEREDEWAQARREGRRVPERVSEDIKKLRKQSQEAIEKMRPK